MKKDELIRNDLVIEGTRIGTWDWHIQNGKTIFNERWAEIIGYRLSELEPTSIETWIKFAHPKDLEESNRLLEEHFNGQSDYYDFQTRMKHKDGHWIWVHDRGKVFEWDEKGTPLRMCGSHTDITEIKQLEIELKKSIHEKDILLSEVHHRVKNNLQLIQSLVRLKQDERGCISVHEIEKSIGAICEAHEAIYKVKSFDRIDFHEYLNRIIESFKLKHVVFKINKLSLSLPINDLVPLGLIISECITNSIKHGSSSTNKMTQIEIKTKLIKNKLNFSYKDNGRGFPKKVIQDKALSGSFGIEIINSLVEQIDGTMELKNENGACTIINLNNYVNEI
ncbi:MAG: PAS domain S-box protein [Bacteroidetes bacterium]|nr:MAG: PAS domain S-box protein [Bacteroidota bacterium]